MLYYYCNHYKNEIKTKRGDAMNAMQRLIEKDIRPSVLRIAVLEHLMHTKAHPTIEEIYHTLHPKIPTLSKTSVYNITKLLTEQGLAKAITIDDKQIRYDADTSMHGHFMCQCCGRVIDFSLTGISDGALDGFDVQTKEVYYSGICKECLHNDK